MGKLKLEKLPSGSYRVRKTYKGKTYTLTFPYKPSQREVMERMAELLRDDRSSESSHDFEHYANEYIKLRSNVLSPSSVLTYEKLVKAMSDDFKEKPLYDISQADVQREINLYALNHSPKTVRSLHGFIASVIKSYRPQLVLNTTLPQKEIKERYLPTDDDVKRILKEAEGTEDSIGFQLGVLSLRRSEICALDMSDLSGNELHIHSNLVYNKRWIKKETPKTDAGNRIVYLPLVFHRLPVNLLEHIIGLPPTQRHCIGFWHDG